MTWRHDNITWHDMTTWHDNSLHCVSHKWDGSKRVRPSCLSEICNQQSNYPLQWSSIRLDVSVLQTRILQDETGRRSMISSPLCRKVMWKPTRILYFPKQQTSLVIVLRFEMNNMQCNGKVVCHCYEALRSTFVYHCLLRILCFL